MSDHFFHVQFIDIFFQNCTGAFKENFIDHFLTNLNGDNDLRNGGYFFDDSGLIEIEVLKFIIGIMKILFFAGWANPFDIEDRFINNLRLGFKEVRWI